MMPIYNTGTPTYIPSGGTSASPHLAVQLNTPTPSTVYTQPVSSANFIWVQGEAAAKSYPVAPGGSVLLMDSENPVLYAKSVDTNGRPLPLEIYDLVKREDLKKAESESVDLSSYVTKDELASMISKEIEKAISEISFKPNSKKYTKRGDD